MTAIFGWSEGKADDGAVGVVVDGITVLGGLGLIAVVFADGGDGGGVVFLSEDDGEVYGISLVFVGCGKREGRDKDQK